MSRGQEKEAEKVLTLLDIGQAHNMFSQIFEIHTNLHFFPNVLIFSSAQNWEKNFCWANKEVVFFLNWEILVNEIRTIACF